MMSSPRTSTKTRFGSSNSKPRSARAGRKIPDSRPALVRATRMGGLRVTAPTVSRRSRQTARLFIYKILISRPSAPSRFFMAFTPLQRLDETKLEKSPWLTWTRAQRVAEDLFYFSVLWRRSSPFCLFWLASAGEALPRKRRSLPPRHPQPAARRTRNPALRLLSRRGRRRSPQLTPVTV
jgi:hypothetical protein